MQIDNLLWVEDQKEFIDSLMPIVEKFCRQIQHVNNIDAALAAFDSTPFDLVLLDLQLEPNSWEGLDFLRSLGPRAAEVPIIILSGAGTIAECIEALRLGAKDYVPKEKARNDLVPVVAKIIDEFRAQQPLDDYAQISNIERTIKELILSILKNASAAEETDIFRSHVPQTVALKSYERWLNSDEGNQEDFFDLLDFVTIIDKLWNKHDAFQSLQKVINPKNRDERTQWLVELNEARKLVAHPTRGDIGTEERKTIQHAEDIVTKWKELFFAK